MQLDKLSQAKIDFNFYTVWRGYKVEEDQKSWKAKANAFTRILAPH